MSSPYTLWKTISTHIKHLALKKEKKKEWHLGAMKEKQKEKKFKTSLHKLKHCGSYNKGETCKRNFKVAVDPPQVLEPF